MVSAATVCALCVFGGTAMTTVMLTTRDAEARLLAKKLWDLDRNTTSVESFAKLYRSTDVRLDEYRDFERDPKRGLQRLRRALRKAERDAMSGIRVLVISLIAASCVGFWAFVYAALVAREKQGMAAKSRRYLIKGMGVPAVVVNVERRDIVDANRAALDTLEYDKDELVGTAVDDVFPDLFEDDDWERDDESNCSVSTHKPSRRRRILGVTGSGQKLVMVCDVTRATFEDGTTYDTIVAQDITELVQKTDDLEIQKKVLSQFTHEMRNKYTPATHMLEHVQTLVEQCPQNKSLRRELEGSLHDIRLSVGLLHEADQLVATRLQLHKIYSGSYVSSANVETVELRDCMTQRVESAAALGHQDVAFRAHIWLPGYDDCELHARMDMYMWTHLANNLLCVTHFSRERKTNHRRSNARKHTWHGEVTFALAEETSDGLLVFAVRDTGKGMPSTIASRLFKEEVASGDVRGVGLGLVSCKKFAESIGGDCWLEYTRPTTAELPKGGGSEFRFSLPGKIVASHKLVDPDLAQTVAAQKHVPSALTVVIVEDSRLIRKSIVTKLQTARRNMRLQDDQADWSFVEHSTVESFLPHLDTFAPRADVVVTVDQNCDSQGGIATGSDLIRAMVQASFKGAIISVSGDDGIAQDHKLLGAHAFWSESLSRASFFFVTNLSQASPSRASTSFARLSSTSSIRNPARLLPGAPLAPPSRLPSVPPAPSRPDAKRRPDAF